MDIAIASGKGGTGKTTISLALASWCVDRGYDSALLDCDVEEPNADLFLRSKIETEIKVRVPVPLVDMDKCTGCGECGDFCEFSAIVVMKGKPVVINDMCHSCGGCGLVCPEKAISEIERDIGTVSSGSAGALRYAGGLLNIGEPMSPPVIKETRKFFAEAEYRFLDCPPGTSCPVIESVKGSDFVVLITEPTPFGLNDLVIAVEMCRSLELSFGVVINRDGIGDSRVEVYCREENIPVMASIPFSRELAEAYARGDATGYLLKHHSPELEAVMNHIESRRMSGCST